MTDPLVAHGAWLWIAPAADLGVWMDDGRVPNNGAVLERTAAEALRASGADVVAPGPMFGARGPYARGATATLHYLLRDRARGIDARGLPRTDRDGATIAVVAGMASCFDGEHAPDVATVAVQGYPTLVRRGRIVARADLNTQTTWRPALGTLPDGSVVLALARASMGGLAGALQAFGCNDAVYLDGGGSGRVASAARHWGSPEDRPLAAWLTLGGRS